MELFQDEVLPINIEDERVKGGVRIPKTNYLERNFAFFVKLATLRVVIPFLRV